MHLGLSDNCLSTVLLADSGSTKTDWCLVVGGDPVFQCQTQGLNPAVQTLEQIDNVLSGELLPVLHGQTAFPFSSFGENLDVRFYGAGCNEANASAMRESIVSCLPVQPEHVRVESDIMAAAHALCRRKEGIVCILGTGSNSCLYDGDKIVANVPPLGYILGDEGSGAVLGKRFVNALFKGRLPNSIMDEFSESTGLDEKAIISRVYREPMANRFLASLSPFIHAHLDCKQIESLVVHNFIDFFVKNISNYQRADLPVNVVGSLAYYYRDQLQSAASKCGYQLGKVRRSPMEGLIAACGEGVI